MLTVNYSEPALTGITWPTEMSLVAEFMSLYAAPLFGAFDLAGAYWPTYELDPDLAGWPESTPPLLLLHSELDPQTHPIFAHAAEQVFLEDHQQIVMVPNNAHVTVWRSMFAEAGDEDVCGVQLFRQFLDDPTAPVDTSCIDSIPPIDYAGETLVSDEVFGTSSIWGD